MTTWARRRLGQHFLVDSAVVARLVDSLALDPGRDVVVEIGPGRGALTRHLAGRCKRLVAIELDAHLAAELEKSFAGQDQVRIVRGDFLKTPLAQFGPGEGERLRVVGNIPYSITSDIVLKLLEPQNRALLWDATLTVQREVAERIVARPGSKVYGVLSVLSQVLARPQLLFTIPARAFRPQPKVGSAVVRWADLQNPPHVLADEAVFRGVVRTAFGQRRKKLLNTLKAVGPEALDRLREAGVDLSRRPEELAPAEWVTLANRLVE
ncbi:MAG TPA: ribosomal RNA small subunit methyltransferase A [Bacteroidetes bacterium]|nr:ribosomal RNA small subunit methyltransferase A [Bacteroidota bacterium]